MLLKNLKDSKRRKPVEANEYDFPDGRPVGRCATCNAEGGCQHISAPKYIPKEVNAGVVVSARRENRDDPVPPPYVPASPRTTVSGGARSSQTREIYGPKGDPGERGPIGLEGKPGKNGADADVSAVVKLAEEHMQTWLNATLKTAVSNAIKELGDLRGPAGKDGANSTVAGPAGTPGRDGSDGRSIIGPAGRDGKDADVRMITDAAELRMQERFAALQTSIKSEIAAAVCSEVDRQLKQAGVIDYSGRAILKEGPAGKDGRNGSPGARGPAGDISAACAEARSAVADDLAAFRKEMWDSRETLRSEIFESVRHLLYDVAKGEKP